MTYITITFTFSITYTITFSSAATQLDDDVSFEAIDESIAMYLIVGDHLRRLTHALRAALTPGTTHTYIM